MKPGRWRSENVRELIEGFATRKNLGGEEALRAPVEHDVRVADEAIPLPRQRPRCGGATPSANFAECGSKSIPRVQGPFGQNMRC